MATKKKIIELDERTLEVLKKQAKLQKRSLKNFLEYTLEDTARHLAEPPEEYKMMMDNMLEKLEKGRLATIPYEEVKKKYGF